EMPLALQAKLLRSLEEKQVQPLGTDKTIPVDIRVLSATNVDLRGCISSGTFREDLFYRLRVLDVRTPPLEKRLEDLPALVAHFMALYSGDNAEPITLTPSAWAALQRYSYPGNVRELSHAIQHALALCGTGPLRIDHLPEDIAGTVHAGEGLGSTPSAVPPLSESMAAFERECLIRALESSNGSKTRAAEALGISRKGLWEKLKRHGLG
ncbi:MAG: sigma 54-interacting transcriptional regulator, partial [Myxococcales bacterium]|nr:sigma 54-interacting transcriptional regulator [Myxococcales bacterium]